jgi:RES domain-containing protein
MRSEMLADGHVWLRVAQAERTDPLDTRFAAHVGGRWNPPDSFPTLYLNEDIVTARINMQLFTDAWPYGPEDLRDDTAPVLVEAVLPRQQRVADAHTPKGVRALGLPATYPLDASGALVPRRVCQPIGAAVHAARLRGVRGRSAQTVLGAGRELAWFPATARSTARAGARLPFSQWFWS